jgi:hypothetical protein
VTPEDIALFQKIRSQIDQLYREISALSKSKPDSPLNTFKLHLINEKLAEANRFLTGTFKPFATFEQLDVDAIPSNSDVVMVLSQYNDRLEAWYNAHRIWDGLRWVWVDAKKKVIMTASSNDD